jgi:hypothetical protein
VRKSASRFGRFRRTPRYRTGSQLIEMAPGFSVLIFPSKGMVEFGQYFYIKH